MDDEMSDDHDHDGDFDKLCGLIAGATELMQDRMCREHGLPRLSVCAATLSAAVHVCGPHVPAATVAGWLRIVAQGLEEGETAPQWSRGPMGQA